MEAREILMQQILQLGGGVITRQNMHNGGENDSAWIGVCALTYQYIWQNNEQAVRAASIIYFSI